MKTYYCIYKGQPSTCSFKLIPWVKGWWISAEGLNVEKGMLVNGDSWLLIGEFYSRLCADAIINRFYLENNDLLFSADGEYVLAIHYRDIDEVIIYRDRTGLLPLTYITDKTGKIAIGLWIGDIAQLSEEISPSREIVNQWPLFRGILPPESLIDGVRTLSGRYNLRITNGKVFQEEAQKTKKNGGLYRSLKQASQDLGAHFQSAVQKRIDSNLRIGATLSGGNDSSLLVSVLRSFFHGPLKTLFVTFEGYQRNYSSDAYKVSRKCLTDHNEIVLNADDYFNLWAKTVYACQSPINHPCTIGQHAAFKILAQEVDAVFSGKGADTVFGGPFWAPFLFLANAGGVLTESIRNKIRMLSSKIKSDKFLGKFTSKTLEALGTPLHEYIFSEVTFGDRDEVDRVFNSRVWQKTIAACQKFIKDDPLADLFFFDVLDWHPVTYDAEKKLCFFYGLKPLYPFLDYELMESSLRLPAHLRYHPLTKKAALKKYSQNFFDRKFIYKPKEGFGVPLGKWFSEKKYSSFLNLPLEERSQRRGWWNEKELSRIIKCHQAGQRSDQSAEGIPWIVINLELWARICIEGDSPNLYVIK